MWISSITLHYSVTLKLPIAHSSRQQEQNHIPLSTYTSLTTDSWKADNNCTFSTSCHHHDWKHNFTRIILFYTKLLFFHAIYLLLNSRQRLSEHHKGFTLENYSFHSKTSLGNEYVDAMALSFLLQRFCFSFVNFARHASFS